MAITLNDERGEWNYTYLGQPLIEFGRSSSFNVILKDLFIEPIREEMNRTTFFDFRSARPRYSKWKCDQVSIFARLHDWVDQKVIPGGICFDCGGEGLASPGDTTKLWDPCWTCGGRGYIPTKYSRHCARCGKFDLRP